MSNIYQECGKAFNLGYLFSLGIRFRNSHALAEDSDKWITIKGTHIPLDKQGSLKGKVGKKIDVKTKQNTCKFNLDNFNNDLDNGKDPRKVLKEAAKSLKGSYKVNLPDVGTSEVNLGSSFISESAKYLYSGEGKSNPKKRKEIAKRQLFGMSNLETILDKGIKTKWVHNPQHHPDSDFMTIYKKLNYQGSEVLFSVDVRRITVSKGNRIYNLGNSLNKGFSKKLKNTTIPIKALDSAVNSSCELVCIRCE